MKNATSESETGSSDVTDIVIGGDGRIWKEAAETGSESETAGRETNGTENSRDRKNSWRQNVTETPPTETSRYRNVSTETETPGSETNATEARLLRQKSL